MMSGGKMKSLEKMNTKRIKAGALDNYNANLVAD